MFHSPLAADGRTTVPQEIRELIGAGPGTRLVWHVMPGGAMIVRAKTHSVLDLAGSLEAPKRKRVSIKAMKAWRAT